MNTFMRFFYEFISIFYEGFKTIIKGIGSGFGKMFSFKEYAKVINSYKSSFNSGEKILFIISVIVLVLIIAILIGLLIIFIRKLQRKASTNLNKEDLLKEIGNLNDQVRKLMKEKDELMAMKVSQLGIGEDDDAEEGKPSETESEEDPSQSGIRFPKLVALDEKYSSYKVKTYDNNYTLDTLIEDFRCFAASQLKLYYNYEILRPFFAALACGKLIILQGISGTGKTSLAYAWGKFVNKDSCVASVEPSWRDKSDLLGYFNEFTKKFNESSALGEIYEASFDNDVHTIILDEMNLARVEYYFADFLSILEMPSQDEWLIDIVSSTWPKDPKKFQKGKLKVPGNLWYIGTINNDDSTFMITDKVYDRAMPIDINSKVKAFKCREQDAININSSYLVSLFDDAIENNTLTEKGTASVNEIDDYVIEHFRISFGNRIMKQLGVFVPVYVACGGKEIEAIDYFVSKKILRKFDQLSVAVIRDEIDPFISFLNKKFGKNTMKECIGYLERLKKTI